MSVVLCDCCFACADREQTSQGNDYFANGEFDKSILCFTTAAIICPTEPTYMSNSAAARMKVGTIAQYAEAVSDCTLALAYDPLHHKSLYRRGVSLAMLGRWQAAFDGMSHYLNDRSDRGSLRFSSQT